MINFLLNLFRPKHVRPTNTGIILESLKPEDYVVGASPIVYQTRITNGDWTPYAWDTENQFSKYGDALDCVAESFINSIEAQEFYLTGKKVNYSKRWVAKMSGTNQGKYKGLGNTYANVADWIRKNGLVLESSYPKPAGEWTVSEFYKDLDPTLNEKLLAEGKIWLQKWDYSYEYLLVSDSNLDYHLKHSPVNIVIPGHSVCGIYSPNQLIHYLDSYPDYFKSTSVYGLQAAMKGILTSKLIQARQIGWAGSPELGIYIPADNMERFKFIQDNLPNWIPNYQLDVSKTYVLPTKKPF